MKEEKESSKASSMVAQPEKIPSTEKIERRSSISQIKRRDSRLKDPFYTQSVSGSPDGYDYCVDKWPDSDKTKRTPSVDISNLKKRSSQSTQSFFPLSSSSSPNIFAFDENLGPDCDKTKPVQDANTEHDPVCGGKV